ncbi:MAG TPA: hypothetical protein VMU59_09135 [Caulobacteraceae bacterium]|nr:hypothetical protein [Caulobacteraceae bacterium]
MADETDMAAWWRGAALATTLALAACGRAPAAEGPPAATLGGADPIITATARTPSGLLVLGRVREPDLAGDSIRRAAVAVRQIGRAVQAGARDLPPGATRITFELYGVDVDKVGKRTPARIFATDYDVDDLRTADYAQDGPAKVFNLALDLRIDHAGINPINAWCMRYPHVGDNICGMAGTE